MHFPVSTAQKKRGLEEDNADWLVVANKDAGKGGIKNFFIGRLTKICGLKFNEFFYKKKYKKKDAMNVRDKLTMHFSFSIAQKKRGLKKIMPIDLWWPIKMHMQDWISILNCENNKYIWVNIGHKEVNTNTDLDLDIYLLLLFPRRVQVEGCNANVQWKEIMQFFTRNEINKEGRNPYLPGDHAEMSSQFRFRTSTKPTGPYYDLIMKVNANLLLSTFKSLFFFFFFRIYIQITWLHHNKKGFEFES